MTTPICLNPAHMVEMICIKTGELIVYPVAQYIFHGDVFRCPVSGCGNTTFLRSPRPALESYHDEYYIAKENAKYTMWNR